MLITSQVLNNIENAFSQHSLGIEVIDGNEVTYAGVIGVLNNGYLPVIRIIMDGIYTEFAPVTGCYEYNDGYRIDVIFNNNTIALYSETSDSIMEPEIEPGEVVSE